MEQRVVAGWVKQITDEVMPNSMEIGKTLQHPDGRTVKVISGERWASGGFSNWWTWREVLADGSLSEKEEAGYGW
ncbi:hypothetical protein [Ottowia sp.]|uniref:hypothetical protein n=1 Tax=Ottowia sp. TaxID=1898956 RepID=UPI0025CD0C48|nr:hypothetical protein [Ottowia sp.]MBK6616425.1 hypothetical protein [Ottowia sp.]